MPALHKNIINMQQKNFRKKFFQKGVEKYPHRVYSITAKRKYPHGVYERSIDLEEKKECSCKHRTKERSEKERKDMLNRLSRIEGQVRGIRKMVENDVYCPEILIQVSAVSAALNSFNKVLLAEHLHSCVVDDIKKGKEDEAIDELLKVLQKLMK